MMTLKYELNEQDYIDFNMFHYSNSPSMKKQRNVQMITVPVLFIGLAILYIVFTKPDSIIAPVLICALGSLVWLMAYPFFVKRELKKQVIKLMNEGKKDELIGKYTLTLGENNIIEQNHHRKIESSYGSIEKINMDDKHLYVYNSSMSAFMVPHSAFTSTGEEDEAVAYIKEKAGI